MKAIKVDYNLLDQAYATPGNPGNPVRVYVPGSSNKKKHKYIGTVSYACKVAKEKNKNHSACSKLDCPCECHNEENIQ